jgi:hypothetical protein
MWRSRVLALILVILVYPTATVWAQQTIYGCVKNNNGQIRIVAAGEACLPSEHPIQWTSGGAGPAAIPPPATPGPLRVLDRNGVSLGVFASPSYAARQIGEVWVGLPVTATGFYMSDPSYFMPFYQTTDCSGDAYLPVDMNNMLRTGVVMPGASGQLVFSYPGKPDVDRATIHAYGRLVGGTWMCYSITPGNWMPLFGKVASVDVSTFQGPFKIVQ